MFIAPPAMFSTITDWLQVRASLSATSRATVSVVDPAAAGTTILTTWVGKASAARAFAPGQAASRAIRHATGAARWRDRIVSSAIGLLRDSIAAPAVVSRRPTVLRLSSRPLRRIGGLDPLRLLDQLLDGAGDRQRQARLVGHFGDDLHVLERPHEAGLVPVFQRLRFARAHLQRIAQRRQVDACGLGN